MNDDAKLIDLADEADEWGPPSPEFPHWRPFPVKELPKPFRSFVIDGSKAIGCDPSYIALPLLSAVAAAIGNSLRIKLKRTWTEPPILWTAIIGESGTIKSPAIELALSPIRAKEEIALAHFKEEIREFEIEKKKYEADFAKWKKKGVGDPPAEPAEPKLERLVVSDVTIESMAVLLEQSPYGLLLIRDELAAWLGSFNQYKKGAGGGDVANWLEMHRAGRISVDRKGGDHKHISVPRAAVCITGGIQPQILSRVLGREYFENGLASRFLFAMPPAPQRKWTEVELDAALQDETCSAFDRIFDYRPAIPPDGELHPTDVELSPEAKEVWKDFYNEHGEEQSGLTGDLASAWSKLEGYAPRLALLLHCMKKAGEGGGRPEADEIGVETLKSALNLVKWFCNETTRVYLALRESVEETERRQLIELIQTKWKGRITTRSLMHGCRKYREKAADAQAALDDLAQNGHGHWDLDDHGGGPGRPSDVFLLYEDDAGNRIA